jgi:hypothetical protein
MLARPLIDDLTKHIVNCFRPAVLEQFNGKITDARADARGKLNVVVGSAGETKTVD